MTSRSFRGIGGQTQKKKLRWAISKKWLNGGGGGTKSKKKLGTSFMDVPTNKTFASFIHLSPSYIQREANRKYLHKVSYKNHINVN